MNLTPHVPSPRERVRRLVHEAIQRALRGRITLSISNQRRPRRGRGSLDDEGVPVNPNRPNHLTGGAAAALDFESD